MAVRSDSGVEYRLDLKEEQEPSQRLFVVSSGTPAETIATTGAWKGLQEIPAAAINGDCLAVNLRGAPADWLQVIDLSKGGMVGETPIMSAVFSANGRFVAALAHEPRSPSGEIRYRPRVFDVASACRSGVIGENHSLTPIAQWDRSEPNVELGSRQYQLLATETGTVAWWLDDLRVAFVERVGESLQATVVAVGQKEPTQTYSPVRFQSFDDDGERVTLTSARDFLQRFRRGLVVDHVTESDGELVIQFKDLRRGAQLLTTFKLALRRV